MKHSFLLVISFIHVECRIWTPDDLIPLLSRSVEDQLSSLTKSLNINEKNAANPGLPTFRQKYQSQENLGSEMGSYLAGFLTGQDDFGEKDKNGDQFPANGDNRRLLDTLPNFVMRELRDDETQQTNETASASTSTRNPDKNAVAYETQSMAFEMDADSISKIFSESLNAAVSPVLKLMEIQNARQTGITTVPHSPNGKLPVFVGVGDFLLESTVDDLMVQWPNISRFLMATQAHIVDNQEFWNSLGRYSSLQLDTLPIYHDLMPQLQKVIFRLLAALIELSPQRVNPATLIPAMIEILTVVTSLRATFEATIPLSGIVLEETEIFVTDFLAYIPSLKQYIPEVQRFIAIMGILEPHYQPTMVAWERALVTGVPMLNEFENLLPAYIDLSPHLRDLLRVMFDLGSDLTESFDETLDKLVNEAPKLLEFYDFADDFIPLLASNVLGVLRRGGLPARMPYFRSVFPEIGKFIAGLNGFFNNVSFLMPEFTKSLVPLAATIPRHPGLLETTSDLLVHCAIFGTQVNNTVLPTAMSFMRQMEPIVKAAQAPVLNVMTIMPLILSMVNAGVDALPRIMSVVPAASLILKSSNKICDQFALGPWNSETLAIIEQLDLNHVCKSIGSSLPLLKKWFSKPDFPTAGVVLPGENEEL